MNTKTLLFIPTYNERENAAQIFHEIQAQNINADILFVDDNSPDGTAESLRELQPKFPRLNVICRSGKLGIGSAHLHGIRWAYEHGYTHLITMDCDFTHPPEYLPKIIAQAHSPEGYHVVVGSRFIQEGSLAGWNPYRWFLTQLGHFLTKHLLGMDYDATGGFRFYHLHRIPREIFDLVSSKGYSFFFEALFILHFNKFKIGQIPIILPPRTYGHSKMGINEIKRSVELLVRTCWAKALYPEKFRLKPSLLQNRSEALLNDK